MYIYDNVVRHIPASCIAVETYTSGAHVALVVGSTYKLVNKDMWFL
jgi:hypothetical protein